MTEQEEYNALKEKKEYAQLSARRSSPLPKFDMKATEPSADIGSGDFRSSLYANIAKPGKAIVDYLGGQGTANDAGVNFANSAINGNSEKLRSAAATAKERSPIAGSIASLAGMTIPIEAAGAAIPAAAAGVIPQALRGAAQMGLVGASESPEESGRSRLENAAWNSGAGAIGGGIAGKIAQKAPSYAVKATGGTFSKIKGMDTEKLGQFLLDSGLVKPGSSPGSIAAGSEQMINDSGKILDEIYNKIGQRFSVDDVKKAIASAAEKEATNPEVGITRVGSGAAKQALEDAVSEPLGGLNGAKDMSAKQLRALVGQVGGLTDWRDLSTSNAAQKLAQVKNDVMRSGYGAGRNILNNAADQVSDFAGGNLGNTLRQANSTMSNALDANALSNDALNREIARKFHLMLGGAGATAGAVHGIARGGNPSSIASEALLGSAAGLGSHAATQYLPSIMAYGARGAPSAAPYLSKAAIDAMIQKAMGSQQ